MIKIGMLSCKSNLAAELNLQVIEWIINPIILHDFYRITAAAVSYYELNKYKLRHIFGSIQDISLVHCLHISENICNVDRHFKIT